MRSVLEEINLKKSLSKSAYQKAVPELQERLRKLQYAAKAANVAIVICLEGWDAAGKGHVVRKLTEKLDPRLFRVYSGMPPTPLEQRYHFLHRYQVNLPSYGHMAMFVHSWYRRVLEERCDKLVKKREWRGAYDQMNEFERWLTDGGQVLVKFWMQISKKKQRQRFKKYLANPYLTWRVTDDFWRHHRDYKNWVPAVEEMLSKTHTRHAPWTVIESNDQRWAVVRIFEVLSQRIEQEIADRNRQKALTTEAAEMIEDLQKETKPSRNRHSRVNGAQTEAVHA